MQEIEFKFREGHSRIFGKILRPFADVILQNEGKELLYHMIVDSGADLTLIPKSVGDYLGFKIDNDSIKEVKGVGEQNVQIVLKKINLQIGNKKIEADIALCLIEEVPLVLGRKDVFDNFEITFKDNKTVFRY